MSWFFAVTGPRAGIRIDVTNGSSSAVLDFSTLEHITVSTVGYGYVNSVPDDRQYLFATGSAILGAVAERGITAILTNFIDELDAKAGALRRDVKCAEHFLRARKPDIVMKMKKYAKFLGRDLKGFDDAHTMRELPELIRRDVVAH